MVKGETKMEKANLSPTMARFTDRLNTIRERRADREWSKVFNATGSVDLANQAGKESWYDSSVEIKRTLVAIREKHINV
jgi:hypothetical protein